MKIIDEALQKLITHYAPKPLVKCGDIVTANWGWKQPHTVRILKIVAELVNLGTLTIRERDRLGIDGWIGVELYYVGERVNDKGKPVGVRGAYLTNLTTKDGKHWEKVGLSFNHCGLSITLDKLKIEKKDVK